MARNRKIGSIKKELLQKSKEAALAAVGVFNNPNIQFKSETYIILMIIAWTYLLHAYFRSIKIDYRYFKEQENGRKRFDRTKNGAYKHWELERCINDKRTPLDKDTSNNLRFLIGIRHEIEHQMTTRIDDLLSAKFQACCLNYHGYRRKLFNDNSMQEQLSFSLQFSSIGQEQKDLLLNNIDLPPNIKSYICNFDETLTDLEYLSPKYAYRVLFVPKTANRKGQADQAIEFLRPDSELAKQVNKRYVLIKENEKEKFLPKKIVELAQDKGFGKFNMYAFTELWKKEDAKNPEKHLGTMVAGKTWYWYQSWLDYVLKFCEEQGDLYRGPKPSKKRR